MLKTGSFRLLQYCVFIVLLITATACSQVVSNAKKAFSEDLAATILSFDDPETIGKAVPSYLILVSSMIKGDPENAGLLKTGAQLYSAYAGSFTDSPESKLALSRRAFDYGSRAMCLRNENLCDAALQPFSEYREHLASVDIEQVDFLFVFATSWAGLIEANSADWNAVADLPRVRVALERVLELDEGISNGNAHLYLAVLDSLLPPALGGKPELAKQHFERAIELSHGSNLMARVLYAEKYARLLFDRELHDRLLEEVLAADVGEGDEVLANTLAKQKAAELLADGDDYF